MQALKMESAKGLPLLPEILVLTEPNNAYSDSALRLPATKWITFERLFERITARFIEVDLHELTQSGLATGDMGLADVMAFSGKPPAPVTGAIAQRIMSLYEINR